MSVPQAAINIIKRYEGLRLEAYKCPAGVWTVGYGSTQLNGKPVKQGDKLTLQQAEELLKKEADNFRIRIAPFIKVSVNENQLSALISLAFNIGVTAFKNSTLLRKLNGKDYFGAADQFLVWTKANGRELLGLKRRREEERALFLKKVE